MTRKQGILGRQDKERTVFRSSKNKSTKPIWRLSIELILMLCSGIYLLFLLNWISSIYDWEVELYKSTQDLFTSITLIISSIFNILVVIILILTIGLAIILIFGAILRSIRISNRFYKNYKRRKRKIF